MSNSDNIDNQEAVKLEALVNRLRAKRRRHDLETGGGTIDATGKSTWWTNGEVWEHRNPDGPAAADMIERLSTMTTRPAGVEEVER